MLNIAIYNKVNARNYSAFLEHYHPNLDIYYQPHFLQLDADLQGGEYEVFTIVKGIDVFIYPYIKLPFKQYNNYFDITSPYGYCGPVFTNKIIFNIGESKFLEYAKNQNFVTEFVRYHYEYNEYLKFNLNIQNLQNRKIVLLNLEQDWDTIWMKEFSSTNRNLCRKLEKEGYQYEIVDDNTALSEFVEMYYQTMKNAGATDFYYFPKNYFQKLLKNLSNNVFLARIVKEGVTYSSSLFFICNGYVVYYLSARNINYGKVPAGNMLLTETVKEVKKRNGKWFNFGGGNQNKETDPLYKFKKNFGKKSADFFIGKRIHNNKIYEELIANYQQKNGVEAYQNVKHILQFYR